MKSNLAFLLVIFLLPKISLGQEGNQKHKDTTYMYGNTVIYSGDAPDFMLDEVMVLPKLDFEDLEAKRDYYWFRRRVLKAYPYAVIASNKLNALNDTLSQIKSKRKRKKYVRKRQKFLEEEFTPQLKKLTTTSGRVLIKLIYRQTGMTTFEVVKEYRSGWRAFWYNTTAGVFKLSLKYEYDPENNLEDYMIEDILQRADNIGIIELLPPKIDLNYYSINPPEGFGKYARNVKK